MNMDTGLLHDLLRKSVEAAKLPGTELVFRETTSAETESLGAQLVVAFSSNGAQPEIGLIQVIERLERETTLGSVDLLGPPRRQVILQGSAGATNYKIVFELNGESQP